MKKTTEGVVTATQKPKKTSKGYRFPPELVARLKKFAADNDRTETIVIERAVQQYLDANSSSAAHKGPLELSADGLLTPSADLTPRTSGTLGKRQRKP